MIKTAEYRDYPSLSLFISISSFSPPGISPFAVLPHPHPSRTSGSLTPLSSSSIPGYKTFRAALRTIWWRSWIPGAEVTRDLSACRLRRGRFPFLPSSWPSALTGPAECLRNFFPQPLRQPAHRGTASARRHPSSFWGGQLRAGVRSVNDRRNTPSCVLLPDESG